MKVIIPGGSGQVGRLVERALAKAGHEVIILTRSPRQPNERSWDGKNLGPWADDFEGADIVLNLAGRSVNCRYTEQNLSDMMTSRVDSTQVVGAAIAQCKKPPPLWLQMSTATIYAHRFDAANDEATGIIGGNEPDAPAYWKRSIDIATEWEKALDEAQTPDTRKVALRSAMVMSPDENGIFDVLYGLTRAGLGGTIGGGKQYMSWIHGDDFVRSLAFIYAHDELDGPINLAAPNPLPQSEFQKTMREEAKAWIGLPATKWMATIGAVFMRTDTELVFKSRRVVPGRLLNAGFKFNFETWPQAAADLVAERRNKDRRQMTWS